MKETHIAGFTFHTDGSRLICEPGLRAREFLHAMEEDSIIALSKFVLEHMSWMNTNYNGIQRSTAEESYDSMSRRKIKKGTPIEEVLQVGDVQVPIYKNMTVFDENDLEERYPLGEDLIDALCIIFHACAPYLWERDQDCATDGFYGGELDYESYISRNYKELVTSLFGAYTSSFPYLSVYNLKNVYHAFYGDHDTPIEHIAIIAQHVKNAVEEGNFSSDYLPFGLRTEEINLTPKRLMNWINKYGHRRAFIVMAKLVEVCDYPGVDTIEAIGNMERVEHRCDRALDNITALVERETQERINEREKNAYADAQGAMCFFDREPDDKFHEYAIYALRSAVELASLGDTLRICVGGEQYTRGIDTGEMQMYVIEGNDRQYVAHIEEGKICELRGYKNHLPVDEGVAQAALHCLELSHV